MGQHAEDILNGDVDQYTGEWIGNGEGFPRSSSNEAMIQHKDGRITTQNHDPLHYAKGTREIRKELAILIKKTIAENPERNENSIVNECRREMNIKYGKGWREQY